MRSRSIVASMDFAIEGIAYALRTQRNMRVHVVAAILVLLGSLLVRISRFEFIAVVFAIAFVLVSELVNTAIESAVDVFTDGFDPAAKVAKDVAAGAVLVSALSALAVGYVVFFARLTSGASILLVRVSQSPTHVTVVTLVVTALVVLVMKALRPEGGSFLHGGWPSGHTALSTAAAASIAYITFNAAAAVIALFVAALVAQSRMESGTHSFAQVIWGAIVGLVVTTLIFQLFVF